MFLVAVTKYPRRHDLEPGEMTNPQIRTDFPRKIREIENSWIEMTDGVRLVARIWLPVDADTDPVPAILEYFPYRKRDTTTIRGTGDSEGVCKGEYLQQEMDEGLRSLLHSTRQAALKLGRP